MAKHKTPTPKFRQYNMSSLVQSVEKQNRNKPEVCYEFSNGDQKVDTDRTNSGIYER